MPSELYYSFKYFLTTDSKNINFKNGFISNSNYKHCNIDSKNSDYLCQHYMALNASIDRKIHRQQEHLPIITYNENKEWNIYLYLYIIYNLINVNTQVCFYNRRAYFLCFSLLCILEKNCTEIMWGLLALLQ